MPFYFSQRSSKDYHAVLGVPRNAGPDAIKAAYRKLALIKHPDKNGNTAESTAAFQEIHEAYEALSRKPSAGSVQDQHQAVYMATQRAAFMGAQRAYANLARDEALADTFKATYTFALMARFDSHEKSEYLAHLSNNFKDVKRLKPTNKGTSYYQSRKMECKSAVANHTINMARSLGGTVHANFVDRFFDNLWDDRDTINFKVVNSLWIDTVNDQIMEVGPKKWYKYGAEDNEYYRPCQERQDRAHNRAKDRRKLSQWLRKQRKVEREQRASGQRNDECQHDAYWKRVHPKRTIACWGCSKSIDKRIGVWECPRCEVKTCRKCMGHLRSLEEDGKKPESGKADASGKNGELIK
ncbi:hypothetical protein QBC34DRAFT_424048 [Podospora aff. communis PSN243]|uniref:J domain-containing protein n=1 Tax=Podospora aff. communis PSN243 TaxID=3040156 RepID=A0AAV9GX82_9PEZI|nr:hypothetical protein QBC34DRAFT_424048 [Podospora aff. communis PSN243]